MLGAYYSGPKFKCQPTGGTGWFSYKIWAKNSKTPMVNLLKNLRPFQNYIFKASALWANAFYKSKCPSVCVFVCPCVCLFTFEAPFTGLFAPNSWSRMSNIFRDLESLGKSNGKKWSQIWTFLFENCLKSPRKKKKSSLFSLLRYRLTVFLPPLPEVWCPIFLEIRNPWGKEIERRGLRYEHFCLKIV